MVERIGKLGTPDEKPKQTVLIEKIDDRTGLAPALGLADGQGRRRRRRSRLRAARHRRARPTGSPTTAAATLVLAFYPGDATTVCTKQFCSYRDKGDRLDELDAEVLGISPQSVDSHERWVKEQELNVPLLADEDMAVAKRYGVTGWLGPLARFTELKDAPGGRYVMRAIFVIDGEGDRPPPHTSRGPAAPTSRSTTSSGRSPRSA